MNIGRTPYFVVWDVTYACPLRCTHCYSESGRRASRQLGLDGLYRVADALISMKPKGVILSGGEPLLVREIFEVVGRMCNAGIAVHLYTSGWVLTPTMLPSIMNLFTRVTVSVDGATAKVHDHIRGRAGSYARAMNALTQLDHAVRDRRRRGERSPSLGIDFVVMQSNCVQLEELCTVVAPKFPGMNFISFNAVVPTGLGSRAGFVEQEILNEEQVALLREGQLAQKLQSLAPDTIEVTTTDNRVLQMHPDFLAAGMSIPVMQIEPDGMVRAMPIYEGTVGSLLTESPGVLWERAVKRWSDPFVIDALTPARTMTAWAEATRRIDQYFGSAEDRARISRRPPYMRTVGDDDGHCSGDPGEM